MDKTKFVNALLRYQRLYQEIEAQYQYKTSNRPFGDDITHLNIDIIIEHIELEHVEDTLTFHWQLNVSGKLYFGEMCDRWALNTMLERDIRTLYFNEIDDELTNLSFKQHLLKNILTYKH